MLLGLLLVPVILKKQLEELKIVAFSLFMMVVIFVVIIGIQLAQDSPEAYNPDLLPGSTVDYPQVYLEPKPGEKLMSAMSVFLIAFSCQQNLFPIYSELKEKNTRGLTIVFASASFLVLTLYVIMSSISMFMFGSYNDVESTVLDMISRHQFKPCTQRAPDG